MFLLGYKIYLGITEDLFGDILIKQISREVEKKRLNEYSLLILKVLVRNQSLLIKNQ